MYLRVFERLSVCFASVVLLVMCLCYLVKGEGSADEGLVSGEQEGGVVLSVVGKGKIFVHVVCSFIEG